MDKMAQYRQTARRRQAEERLALLRWRDDALVLARQAAVLLRQAFGVSQIVLFGSLARPVAEPMPIHGRSDIDLAVWGIAEGDYLRAVSQLLDLGGPIDIDLVRIEEATPRLHQIIEKEGVPL